MTAKEYRHLVARNEHFHLIDHPLAKHKLSLMRQVNWSTSKFRQIATEMGIFLAYEASKKFPLSEEKSEKQNMVVSHSEIAEKKAVIVPIIRSGLPLSEGALQIIPSARIGHMGFRKTEGGNVEEHLAFLPDPVGRHFLLMDTEVGTGKTAKLAIDILKNVGVTSDHISLCTIIIAPEGYNYISKYHPDIDIYAFSFESGLDESGNIVPGFQGDINNKLFGI